MRHEKRLAPRRNTVIPARVAYGNTVQDCIIRNISDTGAKLEIGGVGSLPPVIELHAKGHRPYMCRIVWRAMREVGVAFQM